MLYSVRYLWFNERHTPVVVQAVNGPCPLLAIVNCLLLRGQISLPPQATHVEFEQLSNLLKTFATTKMEQFCVKEKNETLVANALTSFEDSLKLLPSLEHGLDLNVIHAGPSRFEFTPAIGLFDLFEVRLVHGWCYDSSDGATATAIANHSYNEMVNILSCDPNDSKGEHKSGAAVASQQPQPPHPHPQSQSNVYNEATRALMRKFLDQTAMQLTDTGLKLMREVIRDGELSVLFRNNHFACIYRHRGALFSLITDHSLLTAAPSLAWTSLDVRGDEHYFDQMFLRPKNDDSSLPSPYARATASLSYNPSNMAGTTGSTGPTGTSGHRAAPASLATTPAPTATMASAPNANPNTAATKSSTQTAALRPAAAQLQPTHPLLLLQQPPPSHARGHPSTAVVALPPQPPPPPTHQSKGRSCVSSGKPNASNNDDCVIL